MEEKKKVYIVGRKGRGSEIIDTLKGLGATKTMEISGEAKDTIYFIDHNDKITCALIDSEFGAIIMDNYKEIILPQKEWKDGDILAYNGCDELYCSGVYAVFKEYAENDIFDSYIFINNEYMRFGISFHTKDYHLANEVEKEDFSRKYDYMKSYLNAANTVLKRNG